MTWKRFAFTPKIPRAESNTCTHNNPRAARLRERDGISEIKRLPGLGAAGFAARLVHTPHESQRLRGPGSPAMRARPSRLSRLPRASLCSTPFNTYNHLESRTLP